MFLSCEYDCCDYEYILINSTDLHKVEGFVKSLQYYVHISNEEKL